eukprot:gene33584-19447_t
MRNLSDQGVIRRFERWLHLGEPLFGSVEDAPPVVPQVGLCNDKKRNFGLRHGDPAYQPDRMTVTTTLAWVPPLR